MNGFLNLLKPPGMTSSGAVVQVRRTLSGEKVGHAGTLDPEVAGVLPIMIGKASRLFDVLVDKEKRYIAEIAFGVATDTQDAHGSVIARSDGRVPSRQALEAVLPKFMGNTMQTPPVFSALKVQGQTAYSLARQGKAPVLAPRPAYVERIELLEMRPPDGAMLHIVCGKGVYVRTLCHDIGAALGCPAHMRFLLRTQSGMFSLEDSVTIEEWMDSSRQAALLTPMDMPLVHLPAARVAGRYRDACKNGTPMVDFEDIDAPAMLGGPVRIYCGSEFAGIATYQNGALRFQAMLLT